MHAHRLGDDVGDLHARVERAIGILEHHLNAGAHVAHPASRQAGNVRPVDGDGARGGLQEAQREAAERALAGTRFTHEAERLARAHVERHAVHRAHACARAAEERAPPAKTP